MFGRRARSTGGGAFGSRQQERPAPIRRDEAKAKEAFAVGDSVSHKTFGPGKVVGVSGDIIEVQFSRTGARKKLMRGFAPIVKVG